MRMDTKAKRRKALRNALRNRYAKELRTPRFKSKVIPNKKKHKVFDE